REPDEERTDPVADRRARQEGHGSEREPRNAEHGPEEIEHAKRPLVPAGRLGRGEGGGGEGEKRQGERPPPPVRGLCARLPHARRLREHGGDGGGEEGEAGDHGAGEGTPAPCRERREKVAPHFEKSCTSSVPCTLLACSTTEHGKDTWVTASPRRRIPEATV